MSNATPLARRREISIPFRLGFLSWGLGMLLGGCATTSLPHTVETEFGVARAETAEVAQEMAGDLERLLPAVLGLVPHTRPVRAEVWVQDELHLAKNQEIPEQVQGFNTSKRGRIHIRTDADSRVLTLAHELVHATLGATWNPLPGVIEEGLCEWVAIQVAAENPKRQRARRLFQAALYLGTLEGKLTVTRIRSDGLRLTAEANLVFTLSSPSPGSAVDALRLEGGFPDLLSGALHGAHYSLGYWLVARIVDRIGLEGLHALCRETERRRQPLVPVEALLAAADLPSDPSVWQPIVLARVGEEELRQIAIEVREDLVDGLLGAIRPTYPRRMRAQEFLSISSMAFGLDDYPGTVDLTDLGPIRKEVLRRW